MSRLTYTGVTDWMNMPMRELIAFWEALKRVMEREQEAREAAARDR